MQIYVTKDQHRVGPYTAAEARNQILTGHLTGADLAWHEGLPSWVTLSEILASQPSHPTLGPIEPMAPAPPLTSGFGVASFVAAIVGAIGWFLILICVVVADRHGTTKDENSPVLLLMGLFTIGALLLNIFGAVGGIVALVKGTSRKWMAVIGLVANALEFCVVFGLMIIGIAMK